MADIKENVIEWITGDDRVTVSLTQKRFINRVKRLAEKHGEAVEIVAENADGSICAHLPLKALHLTIYAPNMAGFAGIDVDDDGEEIEE